jgi:hypothetical protein
MESQRGVVPRFAVGIGPLNCGVANHSHRLRGDVLAADDQRDAVFARHDEGGIVSAAAAETAATATASTRPATGLGRQRLIAEIPVHAIDAGIGRIAQIITGERANDTAGGIANSNGDVRRRHGTLQVIADRYSEGRVLAAERFVGDEAAVVRWIELHGRATEIEEERIGAHRFGGLLYWCGVVQNPDAAPVRRQDHVVLARMEDDLVDRNGWQSRADPIPAAAAIRRDEQAELGASVEHRGILRIFGQRHHHLSLGQTLADQAEVLAAVGARVDIVVVVVVPVVIKRDIDGVGVVRRGHQAGYIRVVRHVRETRVDVGPRLAAVLGHVDRAVVGAGVEHPGLLRRLGDLDQVSVRLHPVMLGDREILRHRAHER